jgi:integrase
MSRLAMVRTRKRGKTYSYIFEAGKTPRGKRKVIEKGGFPSPDDAYNAGVAAYNDWKHGNIGITSTRISLSNFITKWMDNVVKLNVRPSTFALYTQVIAHHIKPYIGETLIQDITPALLDHFIRKLTKTGLSRSVISSAQRILHQVLDYAVYPSELISSNPAKYIHIPKTAPKNIVKRTIITPQQYANFMKLYPFGSLSHIPVAILYHTGMRIGEVLALCWDDVDFEHKVINVHRQYSYICKIGKIFTEPKTSTSTRKIMIDDNLVTLLKRWKIQQNKWELSGGNSYCIIDEKKDHTVQTYSKVFISAETNRQKMICTELSGKIVSRATVMQHLKNIGLNTHSFRHTHATMLIEAGASLKGVAARLGHKRVEITENLYTHNTTKMQQDTLKGFAKTLQTKP